MNNGVPPTVTSRTFASIAEQDYQGQHVGMTRKSLDYLPPSFTGAMPASRNEFQSSFTSTRPSNDNPFDAAMQAVEETRSRAERRQVMPSTVPSFGSSRSFQHASPLTPASLSLKGDKIMRLLAANQNGSLASPSSISQMSQNPFSLPERIAGRNDRGGLRLPSRGIKFPPRRMTMEYESNDFMLDAPTGVDVSASSCLRRSRNTLNEIRAVLKHPSPSRGIKRGSDESSFSSDSSCGSRKQARRLNVMNVSDTRSDGSAVDAGGFFTTAANGEQSRGGGFDRFRRHSNESQSNPITSSPVPSVIKTVPNRRQKVPPLRFFNNGIEVDIHGNPLPQPEPEPEPVDLDTLKDHQKSVWDQFTETPEEVEARKKKKTRRRRAKSTSSAEEEPAKPLNLKVDPTPSALSADPSKLATADVDALVQDSLKEREKTLSAASVLMGFLGGNTCKSTAADSAAK